jgi:serine protease Do
MDHVADASVGETMKIVVLRNGKKEDFSVVIGDRAKVFASTFGGQRSESNEPGEGTQAKFGLVIQDLNASLRQNLNYSGAAGVLVTQVEGGSFADDIGLLQNDIIVQINRQPVTSAEELKRIQNTLKPGDAVVFKIMRAGRGNQQQQQWTPSFVPGTLPAAGQ